MRLTVAMVPRVEKKLVIETVGLWCFCIDKFWKVVVFFYF